MPTENPRITITVSPELQSRLDDYKYKHRMKNQTQTIVSLIEKGIGLLEASHSPHTISDLSPDESNLIAQYRTLDESGKTLVDFVVSHESIRSAENSVFDLNALIEERDAQSSPDDAQANA